MKNIHQKRRYLALAVVAVIAIVLVGISWYALSRNDGGANATTETVKPVATNKVTYTAEKGKTALAQLLEVNTTVVTKTASFGTYVDSINGLKGGADGKYWSFYVDGKMAAVGAGAYVAKGGEEIVWKYQ